MNEIERHQVIHLVAARGYDPRTVANVLSGKPSKKRLVYARIRQALIECGVTPPSPEAEKTP